MTVMLIITCVLLFLLLLNIRNILLTVTKNQAEIGKGLARIIKALEDTKE